MELVERPVYAHGHVQVVQASVLADLVHHGSHAGAADLGGAVGHGAAHLLDDDAVVAGAVQAQLLQDGPDLQQRQTIAVGRGGREGRGRGQRSAPTAGGSPDTLQLPPGG